MSSGTPLASPLGGNRNHHFSRFSCPNSVALLLSFLRDAIHDLIYRAIHEWSAPGRGR